MWACYDKHYRPRRHAQCFLFLLWAVFHSDTDLLDTRVLRLWEQWLRRGYHHDCAKGFLWVKLAPAGMGLWLYHQHIVTNWTHDSGKKLIVSWSHSSEFENLVSSRQASLVTQMVKNLPAMWETWVRSLGWEDPLEEGMATHSSNLAWRIPWTEEPGGLQYTGLQRVGHDWVTKHRTDSTSLVGKTRICNYD